MEAAVTRFARASGRERKSSSPPPARSPELLLRVLLGQHPQALANFSSYGRRQQDLVLRHRDPDVDTNCTIHSIGAMLHTVNLTWLPAQLRERIAAYVASSWRSYPSSGPTPPRSTGDLQSQSQLGRATPGQRADPRDGAFKPPKPLSNSQSGIRELAVVRIIGILLYFAWESAGFRWLKPAKNMRTHVFQPAHLRKK